MTHHEAFEHHEHPGQTGSSKTCRVCSSAHSPEQSHMGICNNCGYKILIVLFIVMIAVSYVAWFGIL